MPQKRLAKQATRVVMAGNIFLLIIKACTMKVSESLAIVTETVNSVTDVFASIAVLICVGIAAKSADESHPFGHSRAEPLAGLVVAIFTGIMGWEVLHAPVRRLLGEADAVYIGPWALPALVVTLLVKSAMTWYLKRAAATLNSPAIKATSIDCRNDVLVASLAILGVVLGSLNPMVDAGAGLLISVYILYNAFEIGRENINYLMGAVPSDELLASIYQKAQADRIVKVDNVTAHYVGTFVHVELDIHLDGALPTVDAHDIAEEVRERVQSLPVVDRAFVHIEPYSEAQPGGDDE